jgi:hypothetical protein
MSTDAVTPAVDTAELEDWGPLAEATGGAMRTSVGLHETVRKVYVIF